jgi:Transposase DDE domain
VANRLVEPLSKLACHEQWLPTRVHLPEAAAVSLDQLYGALDFLETHSAEIEREVFFRTADLFRADVDLIFWDTTSVYFEVDDEDEDAQTRRGRTLPPLRKRGHSKDRRDGDPQIVVGLALTREGLPVRTWVFPGNTVDVTTVARVKDDLRGWKLGRAIFVGDAGMDSEANRKELSKGLGHYILAMPVGKLKEVQDDVLARPGRFRKVAETLEVKEVVIGEGERRRRYIVCRNQDEAARQRHHRAEILAALKAELGRLDPEAPAHSKRACELVASARSRPLSHPGAGRSAGAGSRGHPGGRAPGRQVCPAHQ